jgi:hypothetical protein
MSDISSVYSRLNGADMEFVDKASGNVVFAFRSAISSNVVYGVANALTAHAGGGQTLATAITASTSRFTTVTTTADSAIMPAAIAGAVYTVINAASNSMNVYPAVGEQINAAGINGAYAIAATKVVEFFCVNVGQWHTMLTA